MTLEFTQKLNLEMEKISKSMYAIIDQGKSTASFVNDMYNNYKIICL